MTSRGPVRPLWSAIIIATLGLAQVACTEEPTVAATMDDDAALEIVQRHADEVLTLAGWAGFSTSWVEPVPCSRSDGSPSRTAYQASGSFQLIVPLEQQRTLVERLAQGWTERGYQVGPVREFSSGGAQVTAVTPDEFFVDMTLGSGEPPAMVLVVVTACYGHA